MMRRRNYVVIAFAILCGCAGAGHAEIMLLEDLRANRLDVSLAGAGSEDQIFGLIDGPALFDNALMTQVGDETTTIDAVVQQTSIVTSSSMSGSASASLATAIGSPTPTWSAGMESGTQVLFRVTEPTRFSLAGTLTTSGIDEPVYGLGSYAEVSILDPLGRQIYGDVLTDVIETRSFTVESVLAPGDYYFFANAVAFADQTLDVSAVFAEVEFTLVIPAPAAWWLAGLGLVARRRR